MSGARDADAADAASGARRDEVRRREAELDPSRGRIVPKQLAHVVRRTNRLEEMIAWYREVLGAEVVHRDGMLAFLTYDEEHHRIAIAQLPGLEEQPAFAAGTDHIAFTCASLGDLVYNWERLRRAGIEPFWCIHHGPTISMYFKDPDGNRVELQVDTLPTAHAIDTWMKSEAFAANPIGVVFDPEDFARRFRAGEPMESLLEQPKLPDGATPFEMLRF